MTDLAFSTALEQAELIRRGEVSSRELVQLYLDRIAAHDGEINSYVHVLADAARELAAEKDEQTAASGERTDLPPFHGVPVSIKELNLLEGAPATMSTRLMESFTAPVDEEIVARLKRAGMVPLGKTNAPEFGTVPWTESELHGPCRNPWNTDHTPGGSSGGAAAALAAGLCPASQGSDGGGSIRIPASNCGLYGLKPNRDRVSRAPLFGDHAFGLVTDGMLTRTVADSAAFLDLISGYVPGDPGMLPPPERAFLDEVGRDPGRLCIGVTTDSPVVTPQPQVVAAVESARDLLADLGHEVVEVQMHLTDDVVEAFSLIWTAMIASNPVPIDSLEPFNQWMARHGAEISAPQYLAAQFQLQLACRAMVGRFHHEYDVLLSPVLAQLPLRIGELDDVAGEARWERMKSYAAYAPLVNATGQPAASLPLHWDEETGLPVGVQIVGRFADEATILRLSAQLEDARPWADRRPPGFG